MSTPAPPGFTVKPVRNRSVGQVVGANTRGMILHVVVGNGSPYGWFQMAVSQASSTWWAGKDGRREQYGNPDTDKFWTQGSGNRMYQSVETAGYPNEPLTAAQIETCAVAYAWGHKRYGWPFKLAEMPGDYGLGWHGMGGKEWGGHYGCPGNARRDQRGAILARARQIAGAPLGSGGTTAPSSPTGGGGSSTPVYVPQEDIVGKFKDLDKESRDELSQIVKDAMLSQAGGIGQRVAKEVWASYREKGRSPIGLLQQAAAGEDTAALGAEVAKHIDLSQLEAAIAQSGSGATAQQIVDELAARLEAGGPA